MAKLEVVQRMQEQLEALAMATRGDVGTAELVRGAADREAAARAATEGERREATQREAALQDAAEEALSALEAAEAEAARLAAELQVRSGGRSCLYVAVAATVSGSASMRTTGPTACTWHGIAYSQDCRDALAEANEERRHLEDDLHAAAQEIQEVKEENFHLQARIRCSGAR